MGVEMNSSKVFPKKLISSPKYLDKVCYIHFNTVPEKSRYKKIVFLIPAPKHILWVLVGIASLRQFQRVPTRYVLIQKQQKSSKIIISVITLSGVMKSYHRIRALEKAPFFNKNVDIFSHFSMKTCFVSHWKRFAKMPRMSTTTYGSVEK